MIDERIKEYLAYTFPSNHFQKYFPPQIDKHGISCKIPFSPISIGPQFIIYFFNSQFFFQFQFQFTIFLFFYFPHSFLSLSTYPLRFPLFDPPGNPL